MKKHFTKLRIEETLQTHLTGTIILDNIGQDFILSYKYNLLKPENNVFQFTGKKPGKNYHTETVSCSCKTIDNALTFIAKTYPCMQPDDWNTLQKLDEEVSQACRITSITANDSTRKREDLAIQAYIDFLKSHKLIKKDN